jgi:proteasome lid subunit RPN8/RPN11
LLFLRDLGETEVGGFGLAADDDPLLIEDVQLVLQKCSWIHVELDDASVADFFDRQVDEGRQPDRFARIWIHTHPGDSPRPSGTDEETFARVFGRTDWAVMFILACEGQSYARLRTNTGLPLKIEIPVEIDYTRPFTGCDFDSWEEEYWKNVQSTESLTEDLFPVSERACPPCA